MTRAPRSAAAPQLAPFAALLAVLAAEAPAAASGALHVDGRRIVDADGAVVVLRGVNVAGNSKVPPFTPMKDPALLDPLERWGLDVVRLLFTWEAYEPEEGQYDSAYLDYYAGVVEAARARGIYVIVDFHQDAYSRWSIGGCGEGFPEWAVPETIAKSAPDNGPACANWGARMTSDDTLADTWHAFYAGDSGARARYLAMVGSVAARLHDEPGVVGYDMLNEPGGDELTEIGPLYEDAAVAIRSADPDAILFVSPQVLKSAGGKSKLARPSFDNMVFSPHFYDPGVIIFKRWTGPLPASAFEDMASVADAWETPWLLGELGAPHGTENGLDYVDTLYDMLDQGFVSGTQWVYTPAWNDTAKDGWNTEDLSVSDDQGNLRDNFRVRPYPRRIAGEPTSFAASHEASLASNVVDLAWDNDPAKGTTELFLPVDATFGSGAVASVRAEGEGLACVTEGDFVRCTSASAGPMHVHAEAAKASAQPEEPTSCGLTGIEMAPIALLAWNATRRRRKPAPRR